MTLIEAIILGLVQGFSEFLPISSSGHLTLVQALFGLVNLDKLVAFDLICHLGTVCAIFIVYLPELKLLLSSRERLVLVACATLPLFPLALFLKPLKLIFNQTQYLGFFFLITAFILFIAQRYSKEKPVETLQKNKVRNAFMIGLSQAFAILPGISRSGSTISAGRLLGMPINEALSFSFLMAIPAIIGATVLEFSHTFLSGESFAFDLSSTAGGFIASLLSGIIALSWLKYRATKRDFIYFIWYCTLIGFFSLWYFNR